MTAEAEVQSVGNHRADLASSPTPPAPDLPPLPPDPGAMATPIPRPNGGPSGRSARTWGTPLTPVRADRPRPTRPAPGTPAEPRHCRHPVGTRSPIALKRLGFQHQMGKTRPFKVGIGSVASIATQKLVTILRPSAAPSWTVNPFVPGSSPGRVARSTRGCSVAAAPLRSAVPGLPGAGPDVGRNQTRRNLATRQGATL
jgi:hypothetical protein